MEKDLDLLVKVRRLEGEPVAALFAGAFINLPDCLVDWAISDLDAFYENLDMWCPEDADPLTVLFSVPVKGIQQNLANYHAVNVGLAGGVLSNKQLMQSIKSEYLTRGYNVLEIFGHQITYTQCPKSEKVKIVLTTEDKNDR